MCKAWTDLFKLLRTIPKTPDEIERVKRSKCVDKKQAYYKKVWAITLSHGVDNIMQGFERGFHKHHIDHIMPISYGFKNDIPAEVIGARDNLRPLPWRENFKKAAKYVPASCS